MFNCKKVGRFSIGDSHSPRHQREANRQMQMFIEVVAAKQKLGKTPDDTLLSEVYRRAMKACPSISVSPRRQQGRPCISGTSIPVHLVLWSVEQHGSIDGALKSYPDLNRQQVKDALYFAELVMGSTWTESAGALTETALTA
jgi:uncharacterized protein (DUF433 family)